VPYQVSMVAGDTVGGTQRQALETALQNLIEQTLTNLICVIDCNFNLNTLDLNSPSATQLWFKLATLSNVLDPENLATSMKIGGQKLGVNAQPIRNTGICKPLIAAFPWSFRIIQTLNSSGIRAKVQDLTDHASRVQTVHQLSIALFGQEILDVARSFEQGAFKKYYHDFLASTITPSSKISSQNQMELSRILMELYDPDSYSSLAGIHVASWANEQRLQRIVSILGCELYPGSIKSGLTQFFPTIGAEKQSDAGLSGEQRVSRVEARLLEKLFALSGSTVPMPNN
jgi:hypothetical protein